MRLRRLALIMMLPLAACLDVESEVTIGEDEIITADTTMVLGRQLFDMMQMMGEQGTGLCPPDSEKVETPESVSCRTTETMTIDDAMKEAEKAKTEDPFFGEMEFVRLDDERMKISLPLDFENIEGKPDELDASNPMFGMITGGLEGSEIVMRFRALEVESSNGTISADGTTVELVIPTLEIIQPSGTLPKTFEAVLKYRDCGFFGC
ncbi:hypothetical protein BDE40_2520 [Litoreibacter halocynthiae]|uniref:Lipoprotein n=1 Tax=Litoreibacter halocynthiae TaxID=1242689 RepID=A0A4V6Q386_9RHOB|nr:hypothetical protein [Litoreibacter halocynthiae]TDT73745.1 hypothetical protein BDE40_2520 [Litoreibacter halocynthiae]